MPRFTSSGPSVAPTVRSSEMVTGAGSAPALSTSAISFASSNICCALRPEPSVI